MRHSWLALAGFVLLCSACGGSSPTSPSERTCTAVASTRLTLAPGEVFRVKFTVPSGLTRDVLLMSYLGLPDSGFIGGRVAHRLYDGARLLGTQENDETIAIWRSPESTFGAPDDRAYAFSYRSTSVDFSTIVSATIDARVELSPISGSVTISSAEIADVELIGPLGGRFPVEPGTSLPITAREVCR